VKKLDLGQTISILANIGVIAGIVFLAIELRQNNELLAAQARSDRVGLRQGDNALLLENPDFASAVMKSVNGEPLTDQENMLVHRYSDYVLINFQNVYAEMERGLIDETSIPIEAWRRNFRNEQWNKTNGRPNLLEHWQAHQFAYDPDFIEWMEENVVNVR
jgi:hypothetical protein